MGRGGPEERANKQVAEGGRGETLIPCCARPLNSDEKAALKRRREALRIRTGRHGELRKSRVEPESFSFRAITALMLYSLLRAGKKCPLVDL